MLTSGQVADLFGVTPRTVDRWEEAGKLDAHRTLGGHRRFARSQIYGLLADLGRDQARPQSAAREAG